MKLGDFLRLERTKKGDIPLHTIASKAGINPSILSRIELGTNKTPPPASILKKISKGYDIPEEVLASVIYDLDLETTAKKQKGKKKEFTKVPVVPAELAVKMILEQESVSDHTAVNWTYIPFEDNYCCGFQMENVDFYPVIQRGDYVVVKTVSAFQHKDLVALASSDMKSIEVMVLSEYENQLFLRALNPLKETSELPIGIAEKKRMLGVVQWVHRKGAI